MASGGVASPRSSPRAAARLSLFEPRDAQVLTQGVENLGGVRGGGRARRVEGVELGRVVERRGEVRGLPLERLRVAVQILGVARDQGEGVVGAATSAAPRGSHGVM